jgi:hypothetical protein
MTSLNLFFSATHFVVDSMNKRAHKRASTVRENKMEKLIAAFVTAPTDANRKRLQAHLQKHMMAICIASPAQVAFLTANGFKI